MKVISIGDRAFHRLAVLYALVGLGAAALLLSWLLPALANSLFGLVMFAADQPSANSQSIILIPIAYSIALFAGATIAFAGAARLSRGGPGRGRALLGIGGLVLGLVPAGMLVPPYQLSLGDLARIGAASLPGSLVALSFLAGPVLLASAAMTAARARVGGHETDRAMSRARLLLVGVVPMLVVAAVAPVVIDERVGAPSRFREYGLPAGYRCCGDSPLVVGPDGALWFVELLAHKIGRITSGGEVSEFATTGQPSHLVRAGANLWFALKNPGRLAKVGPAGEITEYPLPLRAAVTGILGTPEGAVWFIDAGTFSVGRLDVDGSIAEFPIPGLVGAKEATFASPSLILGSDGAIWFTENAGRSGAGISRIDRVGSDGAVTPRALPGGRYIQSQLVVGRDGAFWFLTWDAFFGRMTTDGDYSEYPSGPSAITRGLRLVPDRGFWYADADSNALFQLSELGQLTKHSLPQDVTQPADLIVGPDGVVWFIAESKGQQVVARMDAGTKVTFYPAPPSADELFDTFTTSLIGGDGGLWLPGILGTKIFRFQP